MASEMDTKKKAMRSALGRGLSALISTPAAPISFHENAVPVVAEPEGPNLSVVIGGQGGEVTNSTGSTTVRYVDISKIVNNPKQPRQEFKEAELQELSKSIREVGVLQPVLVRPAPQGPIGTFEIVAGERRWRAATMAGAYQLPVIIQDLDDRATLELAIVENVQRENLGPIEEAQAYQRLADEFSLSQQEIADKVGKDRTSVSNLMRLLKLPKEVIGLIGEGKLSTGHAKAILSIKEPQAQTSLAKKAVTEALSVRALEALTARVQMISAGKNLTAERTEEKAGRARTSPFPDVVDRMRRALGTKVTIKNHPSGRGRIEIEYFSEQELERLIDVICR